jgi:hypothetical protein
VRACPLRFIAKSPDYHFSDTKVWKGSVKVGPAGSQTEVPTFNTAILSGDDTQNGASLTGTEGTELVLVGAIVFTDAIPRSAFCRLRENLWTNPSFSMVLSL